jgi:hypothetical protein
VPNDVSVVHEDVGSQCEARERRLFEQNLLKVPLMPVIVRHRQRFETGSGGIDNVVISFGSAALAEEDHGNAEPCPSRYPLLRRFHHGMASIVVTPSSFKDCAGFKTVLFGDVLR